MHPDHHPKPGTDQSGQDNHAANHQLPMPLLGRRREILVDDFTFFRFFECGFTLAILRFFALVRTASVGLWIGAAPCRAPLFQILNQFQDRIFGREVNIETDHLVDNPLTLSRAHCGKVNLRVVGDGHAFCFRGVD